MNSDDENITQKQQNNAPYKNPVKKLTCYRIHPRTSTLKLKHASFEK